MDHFPFSFKCLSWNVHTTQILQTLVANKSLFECSILWMSSCSYQIFGISLLRQKCWWHILCRDPQPLPWLTAASHRGHSGASLQEGNLREDSLPALIWSNVIPPGEGGSFSWQRGRRRVWVRGSRGSSRSRWWPPPSPPSRCCPGSVQSPWSVLWLYIYNLCYGYIYNFWRQEI